jgi:hypothetical protein
MSQSKLPSDIKQQIEAIYHEVLLRPQIVCRSLSVESYIFALETILDLLSGEDRQDSYESFLRERHFGMHMFESMFEQNNHCLHTFIPLEDRPDASRVIAAAYVTQFKAHWKAFLEWRQQRSPSAAPIVGSDKAKADSSEH